MGFNTSSVWIKCGILCLILGTILFVIGFATSAWKSAENYRGDESDYGLWRHKSCSHVSCSSQTINDRWLKLAGIKDAYNATRAFECIGLGCQILAVVIMILFVFVDGMRKRSPLIAIIVLCIVGAICMAIGFIIFATMDYLSHYDIGWSMGVAIAGCCLTFVAGVMAVLDLKR